MNIRYEQGPEVLDDHPDHVDLSQTTDVPVVDKSTAPEMLQTKDDEISAHQRVKRKIKPPNCYGFSPDSMADSRPCNNATFFSGY